MIRYLFCILKARGDDSVDVKGREIEGLQMPINKGIRYFDERLIFNEFDNISITDNTGLSVEETVLRIMETSDSKKK